MLEDVKLLISESTGYTVPDGDRGLLSWLWESEGQSILNTINQGTLPLELDGLHTRMTAGRYISLRKAAILGEDARIPKSIKEGDVTIELSGEDDSTRLDSLVSHLMDTGGQLIAFRKLRW